MSYTTAWDNDNPPGSEAAKNIDNIFRTLRQQIDERMTGAVVVDWKADPVVMIGGSGGGGGNKTIIIPNSAFVSSVISGTPTYHNDYVAIAADVSALAPVIVPQGSKILGITYVIDKNDCTSINCGLIKYTFEPTPAVTFPVLINVSTAGPQYINSVALSLDVDGTIVYNILITPTGGTSYFIKAVRVLYTQS